MGYSEGLNSVRPAPRAPLGTAIFWERGPLWSTLTRLCSCLRTAAMGNTRSKGTFIIFFLSWAKL